MAQFPTIRTARLISKQGGLSGVVIIGFAEGRIGAASYGATMAQCLQLGRLIDFIVDEVCQKGVVDLSALNVTPPDTQASP